MFGSKIFERGRNARNLAFIQRHLQTLSRERNRLPFGVDGTSVPAIEFLVALAMDDKDAAKYLETKRIQLKSQARGLNMSSAQIAALFAEGADKKR